MQQRARIVLVYTVSGSVRIVAVQGRANDGKSGGYRNIQGDEVHDNCGAYSEREARQAAGMASGESSREGKRAGGLLSPLP